MFFSRFSDFHITELIQVFAERLYDALNDYENDLVRNRQKDGINLTSPGTKMADELSKNVHPDTQPLSVGDAPIKTRGGNIYSSLEYAMFSLGLMAKDFLPAVVLLTDGITLFIGP